MRHSTFAAAAAAITLAFSTPILGIEPQTPSQDGAVVAPDQNPRAVQPRSERRLNRRWWRLDANGDGVISRDEWQRNPELFDRLDADQDGRLTPQEFRSAAHDASRRRAEDRWKRLDKDGNGSISRDEWPGRPETFDLLDANKDGVLTFEELRDAARNRRGRR